MFPASESRAADPDIREVFLHHARRLKPTVAGGDRRIIATPVTTSRPIVSDVPFS